MRTLLHLLIGIVAVGATVAFGALRLTQSARDATIKASQRYEVSRCEALHSEQCVTYYSDSYYKEHWVAVPWSLAGGK